MAMTPHDMLDLGGGLNEGQPWASVNANEMTLLKNWYPFGRKLRRRGGVRLITTDSAWDENIYSMFPLKTSTDSWVMLTGGNTKIGKLDGNAVADLATPDSVNAGTDAWVWFQYKNFAYAMRPSAGKILRVSADSWQDAGIVRPSSACTIVDGGAGALSAAAYYGVYTFYNSATGMESNPADASAVLNLGSSKLIDWSGIGVSLNPFVDSRRLYRTLPDQVGEYFFISSLSNVLPLCCTTWENWSMSTRVGTPMTDISHVTKPPATGTPVTASHIEVIRQSTPDVWWRAQI